MEVSSQALKYGRTEGVQFKIGCYLNIGIDHISANEHPDFEDYFTSKMKLFTQCDTAVINLDSDLSDRVVEYSKNAKKVVTFSTKNPQADIFGYNIHKDNSETVFQLKPINLKVNSDFQCLDFSMWIMLFVQLVLLIL